MKLPLFIKIILNIVFYIIYVLFITVFISFILPLVFNIFIEDGSKTSDIIQFVIAVLVLFITTIYRKYFYISINISWNNNSNSSLEDKKIEVKNKKKKDLASPVLDDKLENNKADELDILVAKEK